MIGFEYAQAIHDNLAEPDTDEDYDPDACTCQRRDCYDCADYSG